MSQHRWRPQLTHQEQVRGLIFFALYFLVFPFLKPMVDGFLDHVFGFYLSEALSAAVYYFILGALTTVVFSSFLKNAFHILLDWLPESLFAFLSALAGVIVLQLPIRYIPWIVENPNTHSWAEQFSYSPAATMVIVVIFTPFIEEILFRGLIFGTLRQRSRTAAWAVSAVLFMLYSVWTFAVAAGDPRYLVLALQYLPMALALTWCYDRSGSIWPPIVLHMLVNGAALHSAVQSTLII